VAAISSARPDPPGGFELKVEQRATTFLLTLTGAFDLAAIGRVESALDRVLPELTEHVVFDLRDVGFVDLAGLMTVLRARERAHRAHFKVEVVAPTGLANRVFTHTSAGTQLTMLSAVPGDPR
jgi:anti-anti-sigma factor